MNIFLKPARRTSFYLLLAYITAFAVNFAVVAWSQSRDTPPYRWYFGLKGGMSLPSKIAIKGQDVDWKGDFDPSASVGGAFGYRFYGPLRAEAELGYRGYPADSAHYGRIKEDNVSGDYRMFSFMGNLYGDLSGHKLGLPLSPYIGAGVGMAHIETRKLRLGPTGWVDGERRVFAYQGMVGASLPLSKNIRMLFEYVHFRTGSATVTLGEDRTVTADFGGSKSHDFLVGLHIAF